MKEVHNILRMTERRKELRNSQLDFKFRRQHSIGGYIVDFYCAQARLVIEIDGSTHDVTEQKQYDEFRKEYLEHFQHRVLRFRNDEINNEIEKVIISIKTALENMLNSPLA